MILYTTVPHDLIFQTPESEYHKQRVVDVDGVQLLVQETSSKDYQVVRVLSTNPNDYLTDKYTPGSIVMINNS